MKDAKHKQFEGKQVNGYKIVKAIGQGKFSTVFYGENAEGQPVAVKEVKIFDMMDPKQRDKCLKEVDLMKPLKHPNIIQYIDSFTYNNELIIITQWASKGDLKKLIKYHMEEELPVQEIKIWDYMIQIAAALKHMHEKKIMHRDLKPANIFISNDNSLKVGDLGLGRAFTSQTLEAHSKVGTPLYMAPQLLTQQGYNLNADVWSLGCIVYQMAELRSPFRNKGQSMSLMDLFNNITRGEYKPISSNFSQQLIQIVSKMIVINPAKRLSSAEVLQRAEYCLSKYNKNPKLDCFITMDDIVNKLNLIDYSGFCKLSGHKAINKFYFAIQDKAPENYQFYLFLQICYWLMNLSKPDRSRDKCVTQAKSMIDWNSSQSACVKFLKDIQAFGIKTQIDAKSILQSYGQGVCFLLNQLLNRQLIRINFKFQPADENNFKQQQNQNEPQLMDVQEEDDKIMKLEVNVEEDIEDTHDFQRSLVFKRGGKKHEIGNTRLLQKIKQIDEQDYNIIYSKVDPKDWQVELIRVEKKLVDINQHMKQARKKASFQNFQRVRLLGPRVNQYTRLLKPLSYKLYSTIESDLKTINQQQKVINSHGQKFRQQYTVQNQHRKQMTDKLTILTNLAKNHIDQLSRIQQRLDQVINLINTVSKSSQSDTTTKLKQSVSSLKKQIKTLDVKINLEQWQIRQFQIKQNEKDTRVFEEQQF